MQDLKPVLWCQSPVIYRSNDFCVRPIKCHFTGLSYIVSNWHAVDLCQPGFASQRQMRQPRVTWLGKKMTVDLNNGRLLAVNICSLFAHASSWPSHLYFFCYHCTNIRLLSVSYCVSSTTSFPGLFSYTDHIWISQFEHFSGAATHFMIWLLHFKTYNTQRTANYPDDGLTSCGKSNYSVEI